MVCGYKCFNSDLTNNYGLKFEIGKSYSVIGDIKYGVDGNGFHMCERLEDTLRYFGIMNSNISVCEVIGNGEVVSFSDEYNGYYDMYSVRNIKLVRKLDREEIINMMLNVNEMRVIRFIQFFKLYDDEIKLFEDKFKNYSTIMDAISYYQKGNLDVYSKKIIREKR